MKKKNTLGKWLGLIILFYLLISLSIDRFIIIFKPEINIEFLYKLDLIIFGVFSIVWGAVFGSGAIKKYKGGINDTKD